MIYVSDTHSFVWLQTQQQRKLGRSALRVFERAQRGIDEIRLSVISLFEIALLVERGRLRPARGWDTWTASARSIRGLEVESLVLEDVRHARALEVLVDPFDRLIAATALRLNVPLITADERIRTAGIVKVVW